MVCWWMNGGDTLYVYLYVQGGDDA
jgi:hypothetical protein